MINFTTPSKETFLMTKDTCNESNALAVSPLIHAFNKYLRGGDTAVNKIKKTLAYFQLLFQ